MFGSYVALQGRCFPSNDNAPLPIVAVQGTVKAPPDLDPRYGSPVVGLNPNVLRRSKVEFLQGHGKFMGQPRVELLNRFTSSAVSTVEMADHER